MNDPAPPFRPLTPGTRFPVETTIRDALYDRIPVANPELALIGTLPFQRLEGIQQLGFVSRVWPGARHTRFEHSIGVMHLARLAVEHLRMVPSPVEITDEDARTLCAAALLHDIGHYPFSHAIEELGPPIRSHEDVGSTLIESGEIDAILREAWRVDPGRVAGIVYRRGRTMPKVDLLLRGILSGALDVDKLDYLPRDAQGCNVPYGGVDTARLIDALCIVQPDGEEPQIGIDAKGVSPLHSLINARQEMFDNVYWHHTNRASMAMLLRAVQEALLAGAIGPETLTGLDDRSLVDLLAGEGMPGPTRRLVTALRERRIHKRAVEISARAVELYGRVGNLFFDPVARRQVELAMVEELARLTGREIAPDAILIDIPKPERWRTDVLVQFAEPPVGFDPLMRWREVAGLDDADFKRYEEHRRLIRVVADAEVRDAVREHWERLLLPQMGSVV